MALVKVGGAWKKEKNGKKYISLSIDMVGGAADYPHAREVNGKIQLLMYANEKKEPGSQKPDYNLLQIVEDDKPKISEPSTVTPTKEDLGDELPDWA